VGEESNCRGAGLESCHFFFFTEYWHREEIASSHSSRIVLRIGRVHLFHLLSRIVVFSPFTRCIHAWTQISILSHITHVYVHSIVLFYLARFELYEFTLWSCSYPLAHQLLRGIIRDDVVPVQGYDTESDLSMSGRRDTEG